MRPNRLVTMMPYLYKPAFKRDKYGVTSMPSSAPLMTIHDVATQLNVDERTVRELIRKNELRAIKVGKEWRVTQDDLDSYVDGHANFDPSK